MGSVLCINKATATLGRAVYGVSTLLFVLASLASALFLLEAINIPIVRKLLEGLTGPLAGGNWRIPLQAMAAYCIFYFVLTTTLVMDIDTIRDALHRWVPKIKGTPLDKVLYEASRKQHRAERGFRPPIWKRLLWAGSLLVFWSLYLVAVFTAFDASLQSAPQPNPERILDVGLLLLEQASLYLPMVVYYAGWTSWTRTS